MMDDLIQQFIAGPQDGERDNYEFYRDITRAIGEQVFKGLTFLTEQLDEETLEETQQAAVLSELAHLYSVCQTVNGLPYSLKAALSSSDIDMVREAIEGFDKLHDKSIAPQILPFLAHSEPCIRSAALYYFSHFPMTDGLTLEMLINCFKQPSGEDHERYHCSAAMLIRMRGQSGIDFLFDYYDYALYAFQKQGILFGLSLHPIGFLPPVDHPALEQLLIRGLDDENDRIIAQAIDGFNLLRDGSIWNRIWAFRDHESPEVRWQVLAYIKTINRDFALPILIESLSDPHYLVRMRTAYALGDKRLNLDEPRKSEAISMLRILLHDEHKDVRKASGTAIAYLEGRHRRD